MEQEAERRRQPQTKQEPESEEEEEEKQEKEEKREEPEEEEEEPEQKPCLKPTLRPISSAPSVSSASGNATPNTPGDESPCGIIIPHENSPDQQQPEEYRPKIGLSLKLGKFFGFAAWHVPKNGKKTEKYKVSLKCCRNWLLHEFCFSSPL